MNIAIYGGSFDPPHKGHIAVANLVLNQTEADEVWIVPTVGNPLKDPPRASFDQRVEMCEQLVEGYDNISATDIERHTGASFSYQVVEHLHENTAGVGKLYFVIGSDSLKNWSRWRSPRRIANLTTIVVVARPGYSSDIDLGHLNDLKKDFIFLDDITSIDPGIPKHISSTNLRTAMAKGSETGFAQELPAEVLSYIEENNLYNSQSFHQIRPDLQDERQLLKFKYAAQHLAEKSRYGPAVRASYENLATSFDQLHAALYRYRRS